jgi:proteasome accessory factor A
MPLPFAMGLETEYAVNSRSRHARRTPEQLAELIATAVRQEYCYMADMECLTGAFLANGGRLYTDINGHPEYATPECFTPRQVTAHDKAGERIVLRAAQRVARECGVEVSVVKNNLGAVRPDQFTWGNHESYLSWVPLDRTVDYLVPHLVTRLAYAGSGCLSAHAEGFGFELSQRARHLRRVTGGDTTHARAIYCTRIRKSSDRSHTGWMRAHLIGKDSQRAPLGTYLTMGATGLLFWMLNHGFIPQRELKLAAPVRALRTASADPWFAKKLRMVGGGEMTALEIQEHYMTDAEAFARRGPMPEWGAEVLERWREVLEDLRANPRRLAGKLDAYTKLALYDSAMRREGSEWSEVHRGLKLLTRLRHGFVDGVVERLVAEGAAPRAGDNEVMREARSIVVADGRGALDRLRFVLRLQMLDMKYHELGGLFDDFCRAGQIDDAVATTADVERAVASAPPGGRAARRAELIRLHAGQAGWAANWQTVHHAFGGPEFEMLNPFDVEAAAVPIS